jgi:hypothetical protein
MQNRNLESNLGLYAYAAGAIFLGLVGLASGDFATTCQRVGPNVPLGEPLAYFTAFIEFAAGLVILWRRTARAGATRVKRPAGAPFYGAFVLIFLSGSASLGVPSQLTLQSPGQQPSATVESTPTADLYGNPCDTMMDTMKGMSVMGESMEAMTNHMCITPTRPEVPGDEDRAKAVVDQVRAAIEKYKDYKKAIADGYIQANPTVDQPQFHFTNDANAKYADTVFDPTRPTSLLYYHTAQKRFALEGVMFTTRPSASEDELNRRIPLSVARWHKHTNFCGAPANKVKEYFGEHPKFGMFGSIHTRSACVAEGGNFFPEVFTWMIHVFPYESDFKGQFSQNDDISHVH